MFCNNQKINELSIVFLQWIKLGNFLHFTEFEFQYFPEIIEGGSHFVFEAFL